jgi:hypothetical protein
MSLSVCEVPKLQEQKTRTPNRTSGVDSLKEVNAKLNKDSDAGCAGLGLMSSGY